LRFIKSTAGRILTAGIVAVVGLLGYAVISDAAVQPDCKNLMYPLCPRSVAALQVVDNSLPKSKIVPADRDAFLKDTNTPDVKGGVEVKYVGGGAIEHLGGKYFGDTTATSDDQFTTLGHFTLPKGTWLVNTSVVFNRTVTGAQGSMPQVGLRFGQDQTLSGDAKWGTDVGTVGGVAISPAKGHDLFGSTVKLITVDSTTEVYLYGFGYNYDQSTAGSGEITAAVTVAAARA
jgi:hypothetical protein